VAELYLEITIWNKVQTYHSYLHTITAKEKCCFN